MGYDYRYDPAGTTCSGRAQPGTVALRDGVLGQFPRLHSLGIYNCRNVRGGTTLSLHAEGRAWDAGVRPEVVDDGHLLAGVLVALAEQLGVQEVIWWRRRWTSRRRGWTDYGGINPHTDHVHVSLCWPAAHGLTLAAVTAALGGTPPPPRPPAPPTTPEDYRMPPTIDLRRAHLQLVRQPLGAIRKMQGLLLAHGYPPVGLVDRSGRPDGLAGGRTRERLLSFQQSHQLAADAVCGPNTWRALIER